MSYFHAIFLGPSNFSTDLIKYDRFIYDDNRLHDHLNMFLEVSGEIRATGILPKRVPNRLKELATTMQSFLLWAKTQNDWHFNNPNSIPKRFDALVADVAEMYENFDDYCSEVD